MEENQGSLEQLIFIIFAHLSTLSSFLNLFFSNVLILQMASNVKIVKL